MYLGISGVPLQIVSCVKPSYPNNAKVSLANMYLGISGLPLQIVSCVKPSYPNNAKSVQLVGNAFYVFEQFKEMLDQTKSVQALAHAPRLGHVKFLTALQRKHMMRLFHVA